MTTKLVPISTVMRWLGVKQRAVAAMLRRGDLRGFRLKRQYRVYVDSVVEYARAHNITHVLAELGDTQAVAIVGYAPDVTNALITALSARGCLARGILDLTSLSLAGWREYRTVVLTPETSPAVVEVARVWLKGAGCAVYVPSHDETLAQVVEHVRPC